MAFSLGNIFKGVGGASNEGSVLGIDIGSSSAKIVQVRASRGVAILETYGEIALGPYGEQPVGKVVKVPPERIAQALIDLMKDANVTGRSGGLSIPFSSSLVSIINLPSTDPAQLKRMIPIEARKYIPISVDEVSLDWFVIPHEEQGESAFDRITPETVSQKGQEVLLVAIHNQVLENYKTIAAAAGLNVEFYEIEIFSAIRSAVGHGLAPILVVDIGAATTKVYVVERGIVRASHLISIGGQHMTEVLARSLSWEFDKAERVKRERGLVDTTAYSPEENDRIHAALLSTLSRVFSEVNRVLLSYGQRYNKNVSRVVLAGGGASLPGLADEAKKALSAEIEIADPFAHTEAPAFLADVLREIGPGFSVALGVALRKLKRA